MHFTWASLLHGFGHPQSHPSTFNTHDSARAMIGPSEYFFTELQLAVQHITTTVQPQNALFAPYIPNDSRTCTPFALLITP